MALSDEDIRGFIESWKQDFGEVLTAERARSEIQRLLDFFTIVDEEGLPKEGGSPPTGDPNPNPP